MIASLVFRLRRTLAPSALDTRASSSWLISHRVFDKDYKFKWDKKDTGHYYIKSYLQKNNIFVPM